MRTRAVVASVVASASILVAGWEIGMGHLAAGLSAAQAPATQSVPAPARSSTGQSAGAQVPSKQSVSAGGSYTGSAESTKYGNVQVKITVVEGKIGDITAVHLTDRDTRSVSISNHAAPILRQEILMAQTANVQTVSGATYTSEAYLSSLQSALDQAGL